MELGELCLRNRQFRQAIDILNQTKIDIALPSQRSLNIDRPVHLCQLSIFKHFSPSRLAFLSEAYEQSGDHDEGLRVMEDCIRLQEELLTDIDCRLSAIPEIVMQQKMKTAQLLTNFGRHCWRNRRLEEVTDGSCLSHSMTFHDRRRRFTGEPWRDVRQAYKHENTWSICFFSMETSKKRSSKSRTYPSFSSKAESPVY